VPQAAAQAASRGKSVAPERNVEVIFNEGEAALASGDLDAAERNFRQVVSVNPQIAGAYANLAVIQMRRKRWIAAIANLERAQKLAPQISGIRLNIGLGYYRQGDYWHAAV